MKLVLIEGVGKKESVEKYLGKGYKVMPTMGHVRDLPIKSLGVDLKNNFAPEYDILPDKKKVVDKLLSEAKKAECVILATDPDREGEAIAWHLANILNLDKDSKCRIVFNEISQSAVQNGLQNPRAIDINLVDAQQARRVLDRLVGYKLSPMLCKKVQNNLSAGRVQSVVLRLVVDRDREIENFKPEEYWTLSAKLDKKEGKKQEFKSTLVIPKGKKIANEKQMHALLDVIKNEEFVVDNIKKTVTKSHPSAPFTTPTMQQDASNKLGFSLKTTTAVAQSLYEGVDVKGEGKVALVTYIRTDSVRVSPEAQKSALAYIKEKYGEKYAPTKPNIYKAKKDAQDAHEAIRPISLARTPESLKEKIAPQQYKLYKLIYDRFIASQMVEATYNSVSVDIKAGHYNFKTTGRTPIFDGYTVVYNNMVEDEDEKTTKIPPLDKNEKLDVKELLPEQKYTKPPARYTESSLVKAMEDKGIGRPATYSPTVNLLFTRNYIEKTGKQIKATELGKVVVDILLKYFSDIMDVGFTAQMEDKLDDIEFGGKVWQDVIRDFYHNFEDELRNANGDAFRAKVPDEVSDIKCDKCGAMMVYRVGKFGKFLACPNYPTCKNTMKLEKEICSCPKCGKPVYKKKSKSGKTFYGCSGYPDCDMISWDVPTGEKCPNCDGFLVVKGTGKDKKVACTKCTFSKEYKKKIDNNLEEQETNEGETNS